MEQIIFGLGHVSFRGRDPTARCPSPVISVHGASAVWSLASHHTHTDCHSASSPTAPRTPSANAHFAQLQQNQASRFNEIVQGMESLVIKYERTITSQNPPTNSKMTNQKKLSRPRPQVKPSLHIDTWMYTSTYVFPYECIRRHVCMYARLNVCEYLCTCMYACMSAYV